MDTSGLEAQTSCTTNTCGRSLLLCNVPLQYTQLPLPKRNVPLFPMFTAYSSGVFGMAQLVVSVMQRIKKCNTKAEEGYDSNWG